MSEGGSDSPGARPDAGRHRDSAPGAGDFQASVARLERAVDELVSTATDRASTLIDETSRRLERELDRRQKRSGRNAPAGAAAPPHREADSARPDPSTDYDAGIDDETMTRRLYRDVRRGRICGVCAGIARYYGVEPWVIRCVAVTGLLFFPTIVFPAYWIACFVMDKPPRRDGVSRRNGRRRRGRRARYERSGRHDHSSPAPELGPRFSPRYSLRNVQADLTEVELRLRRMETHVTSGQYELQRELNKIDGDGDGDGS